MGVREVARLTSLIRQAILPIVRERGIRIGHQSLVSLRFLQARSTDAPYFLSLDAILAVVNPPLTLSILAVSLVAAIALASVFYLREHKSRQSQLRSQQYLAFTLASVGEAVITTDSLGRVTNLNPVAEKLTGWTETEALQRAVDEVFQLCDSPSDTVCKPSAAGWLSAHDSVRSIEHPTLVTRNGSRLRISYCTTRIRNRSTKPLGLVIAFRDATDEQATRQALRETEARYRILFDSIDEGFCVIEMIFDDHRMPIDYRFLETNPMFEKQTGLKNATGKRMKELARNHEAHWFEIYGRVATTGEPIRLQNRAAQLHRWYDVYTFQFGAPKNHQVAILFNDITARMSAENALRRSEQNLAVTLNSIGDAVLATDIDGRVARLNPVAEQLMGWTQAEALGRPVSEVLWIINESTRAPAVIPVTRVLATGEVHGLANHTRLIARDGSEHPISASAAPIRDNDGTILGVVLVFRDVTAEQNALRALHDSEALNRAVIDSVMANIAVVDPQGKIIAVNDGWERFARENGADPASPVVGVGANYLDVCARAALGLGDEANVIRNGLQAVLNRTAATFKYEYDCHSPTALRWFSMQVSPLARSAGGAVIAQVNITERKQAEQLLADFKAALDKHAIVVVTDAHGRINYINDKYCAISKYSRNELIGQAYETIHPGFTNPPNTGQFHENQTGAPEWRDEIKNLAKDGSPYWLDTTIVPFRSPDGNPTQYIAICTDITERHQAEDEIRGFNFRLEKLVAERTERSGRRSPPWTQPTTVLSSVIRRHSASPTSIRAQFASWAIPGKSCWGWLPGTSHTERTR